MTRLTASKARATFADTLNRVAYKGIRVVIHRRGGDVAALVPMEDLELLQALEDRIDLKAAREALKEVEKKGSRSWEEVKARIGL